MAEIIVREISYKDYGKCVEISNGTIDTVVTVDFGPRIIRFGFTGGENEFCESNNLSMTVPGGVWNIRGGHRLWHSPENNPRTYMPDNGPVRWDIIEDGIVLSQDTENMTGIKKEMEITMCPGSGNVKVVHRLINKGLWPVGLAAWAITVMAPGGRQIIPMPHRDTSLLPDRFVALWPYSKMNDHRVYWGDKYIVLDQDPNTQAPFKLGIPNEDGWAAYLNHGNMFIKSFTHNGNGEYYDFGSSYETYTADYMMEMESLSPAVMLNPGDDVTHIEEWQLVEGVDMPAVDEEDISKIVDEHIKK